MFRVCAALAVVSSSLQKTRILIPLHGPKLINLRPILLSRTYLLKPHAIGSIESIILRLLFKLAFFKKFHQQNLCIVSVFIPATCATYYSLLDFIMQNMRGGDKSLARPTSRCILFDGENISFDVSLVLYI